MNIARPESRDLSQQTYLQTDTADQFELDPDVFEKELWLDSSDDSASSSRSSGELYFTDDPLIVKIPRFRKSVAHLPKALEGYEVIPLPNGIELSVKIERLSFGDVQGKITYLLEPDAGVTWTYNEIDHCLHMSSAFLYSLPHWVKIGPESAWIDAEKGIPTIQACKAMLVNALDLIGRVEKISLYSVNNQTSLDINLNLFTCSSLEEACVDSQSAHLAAELGEMLGGRVRLDGIDDVDRIDVTRKTFMNTFILADYPCSTDKTFLRQPKLKELAKLLKPQRRYSFVQSVGMYFEFIPNERFLPVEFLEREVQGPLPKSG